MQNNMSYGHCAPKFFQTKDNTDPLALGRAEASCELWSSQLEVGDWTVHTDF